MSDNSFDIIVVGAGHAGCEAARAAARMGSAVLLLNISLETVAQLSCNPAIGGLAKGQLVREIDALGGAMGMITDQSALQFRELNRSKGPAVRSPRAQVDRRGYPAAMQALLKQTENLSLKAGTVNAFAARKDGFTVSTLEGDTYQSRALVITTGTFLNGLIHIGEDTEAAGRAGEEPARDLTASLAAAGLEIGRLKTGTPPRVDGRTVDFSKFSEQPGDAEPKPFGTYTDFTPYEQMPCWLTHTNAHTHAIIRAAFDRAPLFSGQIQSIGPRYCPSVELKVKNFPEHDHHQVFLEPEGRDTDEYYCNGLPTSLPRDVQDELIHSIAGLEQAHITRYGYAIEYDFVFPRQLHPTMEARDIPGLFLAGQINGTSGYEEAAAQGLAAGINAVLGLRGEEPFVLARHEAYIGVLLDDLITKDIEEPYRMFTSRAEYRLRLRQDNADLRLGHYARRFGLITDGQFEKINAMLTAIEEAVTYCRGRFSEGKSLAAIICRPGQKLEDIEALDEKLRNMQLTGRVREQVEIELLYAGYTVRQERLVRKYEKREKIRVPADMDFLAVEGIKKEAREKLQRLRPETLGQASRIAGVTPADINVLMVCLHSRKEVRGQKSEVSKEGSG